MAKPNRMPQLFNDIILDVSEGKSVVKACKERNASTQSFYDYIETDPKLKETYTRAREDRGDTCTDKIEEYQRKLEQGLIDAQTARVLIDTEKWKAGKFNQRMYGDKVENVLSGAVNVLPAISIKDGNKEKQVSFDVGDDDDGNQSA